MTLGNENSISGQSEQSQSVICQKKNSISGQIEQSQQSYARRLFDDIAASEKIVYEASERVN